MTARQRESTTARQRNIVQRDIVRRDIVTGDGATTRQRDSQCCITTDLLIHLNAVDLDRPLNEEVDPHRLWQGHGRSWIQSKIVKSAY